MTDWKFLAKKYLLRKYRKRPGIYGTEPKVVKCLQRFKGDVALDVGAATGDYTIILAQRFKEVYAFEPDPDRSRELRAKLQVGNFDNVKVMQVAISDREGETTLWLDSPAKRPGGPACTIMSRFDYKPAARELRPYSEQYQGKRGVTVKMIPLAGLQLPRRIDLVKIDVEGAEFQVLAGASPLLDDHRILRMIIELHDRDQKSKLESILSRHGYEFEWIDPDHVMSFA